MKFNKLTINKKAISFYSHHLNKEKLNSIKIFAEKFKFFKIIFRISISMNTSINKVSNVLILSN